MSRSIYKNKWHCDTHHSGSQKELVEAGIGVPVSWMRNVMMRHGDDRKWLKAARKAQNGKRRAFLKQQTQKLINDGTESLL